MASVFNGTATPLGSTAHPFDTSSTTLTDLVTAATSAIADSLRGSSTLSGLNATGTGNSTSNPLDGKVGHSGLSGVAILGLIAGVLGLLGASYISCKIKHMNCCSSTTVFVIQPEEKRSCFVRNLCCCCYDGKKKRTKPYDQEANAFAPYYLQDESERSSLEPPPYRRAQSSPTGGDGAYSPYADSPIPLKRQMTAPAALPGGMGRQTGPRQIIITLDDNAR